MKRSTVARHAPHRSPSAWGSALRMLGIGIAVVTVSALGIGGFIAADLALRVSDGAVDLEDAPEVAPPSLGAYPGEFAILLVGTDECGAVSKQKLGARCVGEDGIRNDVNLLVHVSPEPRKVSVVSLPRDLMIEVPECTREDGSVASRSSKAAINTVFERAGLSCVAKSVSELSGIDIGFAAKLSFDGVMEITDAIGGVEICVGGTGIRDRHTDIDWDPGPRTVSGYEALQFIRVRKGIGDGSDLARISNQQQYMSRLAKTILSSETLTDVPKVLRLANVIADNVEPSKELANPVRLAQLALALKDVPFDEFKFLQLPTLEDPADADRVVTNESAAEPMWEAIRTGESMQITGRPSNHGGVVAEGEAEPPSESPSAAPSPSASPTEGVVLSDQISGIDLNQETCSGGKRR
ncbi:LytR family transcriptional regulator [Microbacterium esteraromaticum]|uniref:LytR family transcriptional regulator n=1 Tax=Microbacterium esteraromaticum TaxID=57043 RepID=A0A7D8AGL1_9MICO|nr:LCP family protein [Microbacterium esteraromaticum]QMU97342.1 LytR family transcriptional regulator [Microbacterium esteraromaticum]